MEKSVLSQGRIFPGGVEISPLVSGEEKEERAMAAMEEARGQEKDSDTIWTDGSRLADGRAGGGIAWYEGVAIGDGEGIVTTDRRGVVRVGERRRGTMRTYHDRQRPLRPAQSGWRGVGFGMSRGHEAYDAELTAIAYGLEERRERKKLHSIHGLHSGHG